MRGSGSGRRVLRVAAGLAAAALAAAVAWPHADPQPPSRVVARDVASLIRTDSVALRTLPPSRSLSDEQLADRAGFTPLRPAYVPDGCSLDHQYAQGHEVYMTFAREPTQRVTPARWAREPSGVMPPREGCLSIVQQQRRGPDGERVGVDWIANAKSGLLDLIGRPPDGPQVAPVSAGVVDTVGPPGLYLRAGWTIRMRSDPLSPDSGFGLTVLVERDDLVILVSGPHGLEQNELLRIAASLR